MINPLLKISEDLQASEGTKLAENNTERKFYLKEVSEYD